MGLDVVIVKFPISLSSVTTSSEEHAKIIEKIINNSEKEIAGRILFIFLYNLNTPYIQQVGERLSSNFLRNLYFL